MLTLSARAPSARNLKLPSLVAMAVIAMALLVPVTGARAIAADLAYGDVIKLDDAAFEIEIDEAAGLAYVATQSSPRVFIVDPAARTVVDEITVAAPTEGISLSPDGSKLYVALRRLGSVAEVDIATGTTLRTFDLSDTLGDEETFDVQLVNTNRLFVTANPGAEGLAYVAKLNLNTEEPRVVASGSIFRFYPQLDWDGGDSLFVTEGFTDLARLDLTKVTAPIVAETQHGTVSRTERAIVAAHGSRVITGGGQEVDAATLQVVGSVPVGFPAGHGGDIVFFAQFNEDNRMRIQEYDLATDTAGETHETTCATANGALDVHDFKVMPGSTVFLATSDHGLCIVDINAEFPLCGGLEPTVIGTSYRDELDGTPGNDVMLMLGGNDVVNGMGGDDVICAGEGYDTITTGSGDDRIFGGASDDEIEPGAGNDSVFGEGGIDTVVYESAEGPMFIDLVAGTAIGSGGDTVHSIENVKGSPGNDVLSGDSGPNRIEGNAGNDRIEGRGGADDLRGDDGDDTLRGGGGADDISGDDGDDTLFGGKGSDDINGGSGLDLVSYEGAMTPVIVDLAKERATGQGLDSLSDIEDVVGGPFDDAIKGDAGDNHLIGAGGDDVLRGAGGNDILDGGLGNDQLVGGPGTDAASFASESQAVVADLGASSSTGQGSDSMTNIEGLIGSGLGDVLRGDVGPNRLVGSGGADRLVGRAGADELLGNRGNDELLGNRGPDTLWGGSGSDDLDGGAGNDTLRGGPGSDNCLRGEDVAGCE